MNRASEHNAAAAAVERMRPIVPVFLFLLIILDNSFTDAGICVHLLVRSIGCSCDVATSRVREREREQAQWCDAVQHEFGGDKCIFYCEIYMTDYAITNLLTLHYCRNDVQQQQQPSPRQQHNSD